MLCDALDQAEQVTDESSALELMGYAPLLVEGHACNLKVTLPADLCWRPSICREISKTGRDKTDKLRLFDEK
jgi:2-C-methyl-D-erythritol 4-phosphate cytidylyltransferase